jgi:hypothetical protein
MSAADSAASVTKDTEASLKLTPSQVGDSSMVEQRTLTPLI